jgi:hypothetical protein
MAGAGCEGCGLFERLNQSEYPAQMRLIFRSCIVDRKKSRHGGLGGQIRVPRARRIPQNLNNLRHLERLVTVRQSSYGRIATGGSNGIYHFAWNSKSVSGQMRPAKAFSRRAIPVMSMFSQSDSLEGFASSGIGCSDSQKGCDAGVEPIWNPSNTAEALVHPGSAQAGARGPALGNTQTVKAPDDAFTIGVCRTKRLCRSLLRKS